VQVVGREAVRGMRRNAHCGNEGGHRREAYANGYFTAVFRWNEGRVNNRWDVGRAERAIALRIVDGTGPDGNSNGWRLFRRKMNGSAQVCWTADGRVKGVSQGNRGG
jgi:hypothetical protein